MQEIINRRKFIQPYMTSLPILMEFNTSPFYTNNVHATVHELLPAIYIIVDYYCVPVISEIIIDALQLPIAQF